MIEIEFDFLSTGHNWTMERSDRNYAPITNGCIYIIHNENSNSTYIGYADNAQDRWSHRVEVFHCMGIFNAYAKKVRCAVCFPKVTHNQRRIILNWKGTNGLEHLLIRAVRNGLLGRTTCTNTLLSTQLFPLRDDTKITVYLPGWNKWGKLDGSKEITLNAGTLY